MKNIFLFLLVLVAANNIYGQLNDQRLQGLDQDIQAVIERYNAVGLAVAVIENDEIIYSKGFGYRDLEQKIPVTPNTLFGIGSITKQFTASLMGIYEGQEKLSIIDSPTKYLPDLRFYTDEMNQLVTIADLMSHHSGIGNMDGSLVFFPTKDLKKNYERLRYLEPVSNVRQQFNYSNMGYSVLGAIAASISGKSWGHSIKSEIFDPIGMNLSNTSITELEQSQDFSFGYSVHEEKAVKVLFDGLDESAPGGSINSSINDMSKWIKMLLAGGKINDKQIVPKAFLEQAFSGQSIMTHKFSFDKKEDVLFDMYGFGFGVQNYLDNYRVSHGGAVSGFTANIELHPFKNIGIVVLSNQHLSSIAYNVSDIIAHRMLGLDQKSADDFELRRAQARRYDSPLSPINSNSKPSLPLVEYCGNYSHPGFGTIAVTMENGQLHADFPAFKLGLQHDEGDLFYNVSLVEIHQNCPSFNFNFNVSGDTVRSVSAHLHPNGVEFLKEKLQ